jgi:hypothetical protein
MQCAKQERVHTAAVFLSAVCCGLFLWGRGWGPWDNSTASAALFAIASAAGWYNGARSRRRLVSCAKKSVGVAICRSMLDD